MSSASEGEQELGCFEREGEVGLKVDGREGRVDAKEATPDSAGGLSLSKFSPAKVKSPDLAVKRGSEGTKGPIERSAGVGAGERGRAERVEEGEEVVVPDDRKLRVDN